MRNAATACRALESVSRAACACWLVVALTGCGSSGHDGAADSSGQRGTGGASSSTGAAGGGGHETSAGTGGRGGTANAGGSGGSASDGGARDAGTGDMSKTSACLEYAAARAARLAQCEGMTSTSEASLEHTNTDCPDLFFSDGATRTVAGLLDCAQQLRELPCGDTLVNRLPDCVTPGTRKGGEPCAYSSQCASLHCNAGPTQCGTCAMLSVPGGPCGGSDLACPLNYECDNSVCAESPHEPPPAMTPPVKQTVPTGAACMNHGDCTGEDLCFPDDNNELHCTARVTLGGNCDGPTLYCRDEDYCDPADYTCKVLPGNGEPCGVHFGMPSLCAEHLVCDANDPAGAQCKPGPGMACVVAGMTCPAESLCCASPDCATPTCMRSVLPGEACGSDPMARCIPGSECDAGTCKGIDSQGSFTKLCK